MRTKNKASKNNPKRLLSSIVLVCILFCGSLYPTLAQTADSATPAATENTPSLENIKKNLSAGDQELKTLQEKADHDQFMSYVYMGAGFSVVIFIAWFTTNVAKKRRQKEDAVKLLRHQNAKHHDHSHRKGAHVRR
jgi:hypothetical protein